MSKYLIIVLFGVLSPNLQASSDRILQPEWIDFWQIQGNLGKFSCTIPKSCKQIYSCDEAQWYFDHCRWAERLDSNDNQIPCDAICRIDDHHSSRPI